MARKTLDKETRRAIREARKMMEEVARADGNEAETRRRVERFFQSLMGYDVFKHISREHAVGGSGTKEHCDFAIQLEEGENAKPIIMVELKRVGIDLRPKHLKQVSSYAINQGCEWVVLTNGRDWRLYHVSFGQPPRLKLVQSWDLLDDDPAELASKFAVIGYRNVRRGGLDDLWQKANVLTARNVIASIVCEDSIRVIRRELRKLTDVLVQPEDIVGAIRRLLNEAALTEMENISISFRERKHRRRTRTSKLAEQQEEQDTDSGGIPRSPLAAEEDSGQGQLRTETDHVA